MSREMGFSVLPLEGSYDGASWWVGGHATIRGAAGAEARLERYGDILATVTVDKDDRAVFFSNKPLLPVGYCYGWAVRVNRPGLTGKAAAELGVGPELRVARPEPDQTDPEWWGKHIARRRVVCEIPVGVVSQDWVPARLSKRARVLGANNMFVLMDDEDAGLWKTQKEGPA